MTTRTNRTHLAGIAACFALATLAITIFTLTGCANFFIKGDNTSTGSTGTTGTSGTTGSTGNLYSSDYVYVSNPNTTNIQQINAYTVANGALTPVSGSPLTLGVAPLSMAVTPNDSLLYVANGSAVYAYSINTSGTLALLQGGSVFNGAVTSIAISPDGNYLLALAPLSNEVLVFGITYGTGVLTPAGPGEVLLPTYNGSLLETPSQVRMCPSGQCIVAALGNVGIAVAAFNQANGALGNFVPESPTNSSADAAYDVAIDANNYIYVPQTNGLYVYSYNNGTGAVGLVSSTPYTLGTGPYTAVVSNDSQYVYVANRGNSTVASTISGFSIASGGALTSLGAAFPAPSFVSALSMDSTGQYLIALGYDSTSGVQLYSISSTGALASVAQAASDNNTAGATATIAAVH